MMHASSAEYFHDDETRHRRESHPVLNVGVIHSKGTIEPTNLSNKRHAALAGRLLANPDIQRLAIFASGMCLMRLRPTNLLTTFL